MSVGPASRDAAPSLPQLWELAAPAEWRAIDFISDLHLQASQPRSFEAFAAHLRHTPADAVFILGDLFEAWVGDDARHDPFEAQVAEVLKDAAAERCVAFMAGNRDFLVGGSFLRECGVMGLPDPTVLRAFGERVLLTHGDALCLADTAYQRFRAEVRTEHFRHSFLARPLAERRAIASQMRDASRRHQQDQPASCIHCTAMPASTSAQASSGRSCWCLRLASRIWLAIARRSASGRARKLLRKCSVRTSARKRW